MYFFFLIRNVCVGFPQELTPAERMSNDEKVKFYELIKSSKPLYERLHELIPIFLCITQNKAATERLIILKHMFHDQVEFLKLNKYIMTLEQLYRLKQQFIGYFAYVRNVVEKRQRQEKELSDQFSLLNI
ncbi:hypothetical protein BDC45DRAFT_516163 [Circinella umbellata]|nr:hypothetical protein BDC45DRAFT_516163 [Circinella umbellata]